MNAKSKHFCPANCGKKFISLDHAVAHAQAEHPDWRQGEVKRKGWATPYGFIDFAHPVTYEHACATLKGASEKLWSTRGIPVG